MVLSTKRSRDRMPPSQSSETAATARRMRQVLHLCGVLMLVVMLWTGVSAQAAEAYGCVEVSGEAAGHFDGDRDQIPSDSDKGTPNHHGGCHGHHVAVSIDDVSPAVLTVTARSRGLARERVTIGSDPAIGLRPPIA